MQTNDLPQRKHLYYEYTSSDQSVQLNKIKIGPKSHEKALHKNTPRRKSFSKHHVHGQDVKNASIIQLLFAYCDPKHQKTWSNCLLPFRPVIWIYNGVIIFF